MISVVIGTYNRAAILRRALQSLGEMTVPAALSWEVVVVNNNSRDDTEQVVREFARTSMRVNYVFEGRQGIAYARNAGVQAAQGDIIAFTDDDVTVDRQWLACLQETFDRFDCMAVGGRIVAVWNCSKPAWLEKMDRSYPLLAVITAFDKGEQPHELRSPPYTANAAFRRAVFDRVGLFRTDLGRQGASLMGGEDTEFCHRIMDAGCRIMYQPKAVVSHPVEQSRTEKKYFLSYYFHYGRLLIRVAGMPQNVTCLWGMPRHLLREFLENLLRWIFSLNPQRRFYYKLETWLRAGKLVECYRELRKAK